MRLWHENLIQKLPRQQLLGQHRECAALRGNGWGKRHATVDYVFAHSYAMLYTYHTRIMKEMRRRGYNVDQNWLNPEYRGKECDSASYDFYIKNHKYVKGKNNTVYKEHDGRYMRECIDNLSNKGILI